MVKRIEFELSWQHVSRRDVNPRFQRGKILFNREELLMQRSLKPAIIRVDGAERHALHNGRGIRCANRVADGKGKTMGIDDVEIEFGDSVD